MLLDLLDEQIEKTIARLQGYEELVKDDGFFLAFSGGKDSCVLKALADMAGVKYDAHYQVTTIDPPELLRFMKEHHKDLAWDYPEKTMWQLIVEKRMPPTRLVRYCCKELKEGGGENRMVLTGIRWQESNARKQRNMMESCYQGLGRRFLHPIIDWSEEDVWRFLKKYDIPYCSLYDEGHKRIGCVGCPMGGPQRYRDFKRWPHYEKMYKAAFQKCIDQRNADGLKTNVKWQDGESMFSWWMDEKDQKPLDEGLFA